MEYIMHLYPGRLIAILHRKTQIYWSRELKQYGISASEIPVFMQLFHEEGITQDQIALKMALNKSAITRIIQGLMEKDLIKKEKDQNDHRCNRIYLTEKGHALKAPILAARNKLNERLLNQMTAKEQDEFIRLLNIAAESIQYGEANDNERKNR